MKLRTGMILGIATLVAAIVASTVVAVAFVVDRSERQQLRDDLDRSHGVFAELLRYRSSTYRSDCRVVANEPRLRAVVAAQDVTRETIIGVIAELRTSLGSDLFLLTDAAGTLIGDALDPKAEGFDLSTRREIAAAKQTGEGAGIWLSDGRPYQVSSCRVDFGERAVGIVAIGHAVDDALAEAVYRQTGSTLIVALEGKPVAASPLAGGKPAAGATLPAIGAEAESIDLAGDHYLARGGRFPGYEGQRPLSYAVMRSLDEALAPARRLTRTVFVIAVIALLAALGLAVALSRLLSRPVDELVRFTQAIGKGELERRAEPAGATEVRALAGAMNAMVEELARSRRALAEKQRLERELEIAARIQTSILPKRFDIAGLEIAARMIPASEVGGDYYDVFPVENGCWIGIGDVAGHGLSAGLEMLMVQSVIAGLVHHAPNAAPHDHVRVLNRVLYGNIRDRLGQDEHVTLTLLRYEAGVFTFAGAHEEILVARAAGGPCERVATPGTWIGAMPDVTRVTKDSTLALEPGDLMVLYTDGITEARGRDGHQFGDRLATIIEEARAEPVETVRDRVMDAVRAWEVEQEDDISIVVIRRR
ncbi:MAG TPA: SpoIIE family protein phosphatase [Kofleriaceae bacterium]|nr:SpoIIE family protein phosphatase [Kofleriaceae bacterium]